MKLGAVLAFAAAVCAYSAHGETIDIRNCPLNATVFVNPLGGDRFVVKKVGTDYLYQCDRGEESKPVFGETCLGPYGGFILLGDFVSGSRPHDDPVSTIAVLYTLPALPCCGWYTRTATPENLAKIEWLGPDDMPLVRDKNLVVIEPDTEDDENAFDSTLYAVACILP